MKKIFASLSICVIGAITPLSLIDNIKAEEIGDVFIPDSSQNFLDINTGHINALVVRVGFKDYPLNKTNSNYLAYSDNFLLSLYEGKENGFGLPYNGLSDFLYTSSYGKLTMSVGGIIDIQLENTLESYYNDYSGYNGYSGELNSINFYKCQEFIEKLNRQINISDYDKNMDGRIDALYIWDMSGKTNTSYNGVCDGVYDDVNDRFNAYVAFFISEYNRKYEEGCLRLLIHETGHLLLSAIDYYLLENAPPVTSQFSDIGSIYLSNNPCDYDGWTKYSGGWLTADNVSTITFQRDSTGTISLTPYDSDTAEGKKIAVLHDAPDSIRYIVVDYCGGNNNNQLDSNLRKEGFRFYKCAEENVTEDIVYGYDEEGLLYQLFNEEDELEIEYPESGNRLKIYDIQTGDNPSFKYSFKKMDTINPPEIQEDPEVFKTLDYRVKVVDRKGDIITDGIEIHFEDITETGFVTANPMGNHRCLVFVHDETTNSTDTLLRLESVPEGYKEIPDVKLHASAISDFLFEVTSDSESVSVSTDPTRNNYLITITLEEGSDNDIASDGEITEPSNGVSSSEDDANEQTEIKEQLESVTIQDQRKSDSTIEISNNHKEKKATVSADINSSGIVSKVNPITPKASAIQTQVVTATNKTAPQTGDKSLTPLWITIAGTSAGVLATAVISKRKKKI